MGLNAKENAKLFVEEIRNIIDQHLSKVSKEKICEIESINDDGTLNVYLDNDNSNVMHNVINESRYNFKKGDRGYIYLIGGSLSNAFVFAKCSPKYSDQPQFDVESIMDGVDDKIRSFFQNINITPTPTPEETKIVDIPDSGDVVVSLENNTDYTLTSNDISSITINIDADVFHGFHVGLNFKTGGSAINFVLNNLSSYTIKIVCNTEMVDNYEPSLNKIVQGVVICDGLCVSLYINEV